MDTLGRVAAEAAANLSQILLLLLVFFLLIFSVTPRTLPRVTAADELVVTVSAEGLAPGDGCPVPAAQQFELTWFKLKDLAMIELKRTAPKARMGGEWTGNGKQDGQKGEQKRSPSHTRSSTW